MFLCLCVFGQLPAATKSTITTMYEFLRSGEYRGKVWVILVTRVMFLGTAKYITPGVIIRVILVTQVIGVITPGWQILVEKNL